MLKNSRVRRERRRAEAEARKALREKRSPQEQLKHLDYLLGDGVGAIKERAELQRRIDELGRKSRSAPVSEEAQTNEKPTKQRRRRRQRRKQ